MVLVDGLTYAGHDELYRISYCHNSLCGLNPGDVSGVSYLGAALEGRRSNYDVDLLAGAFCRIMGIVFVHRAREYRTACDVSAGAILLFIGALVGQMVGGSAS